MGALALRTIHYDTETGAVHPSWSQAHRYENPHPH